MQKPMPAGYRRRLWDDLTGASTRWLRTILLAALVAKLAMTLVGVLVERLAGPSSGDGFSGVIDNVSPVLVFVTLVAAPLFESLGVVALVWFFSGRLKCAAMPTALAVGLLAVPLHGLTLGSVSVLPMFTLFGAVQHHWRARGEAWSGFWIITAVHFLANGVSVLVVAFAPSA